MNSGPDLDRLECASAVEGDVDLRAFLGAHPIEADAVLADLIDMDGRQRASRGLPTDLRRYLDATPDLTSMPVSLDAAIEAAMRSMTAAEGCDQATAAARLCYAAGVSWGL